jgi:ribosomal protein S12
MYINEISINVVCEFKPYDKIVCDDKRNLWQLEYCPKKRTIPLRKLTYNPKRNAYRINSLWVSKVRLLKLRIEKKYKLIIQEGKETPFD